jgi:hypothetical protein
VCGAISGPTGVDAGIAVDVHGAGAASDADTWVEMGTPWSSATEGTEDDDAWPLGPDDSW